MPLTTSIDTDRNGNIYPTITPDITILKGDNFDDLTHDKKIERAIDHISTL